MHRESHKRQLTCDGQSVPVDEIIKYNYRLNWIRLKAEKWFPLVIQEGDSARTFEIVDLRRKQYRGKQFHRNKDNPWLFPVTNFVDQPQ